MLTAVCPVYAAESGHVIINQVYGAFDDGYADYSFIGLYNPTGNLTDGPFSTALRKSGSRWAVLKLTGVIAANGYYLIRCGTVSKLSGSYQVPQGNQEWNTVIHNRGVSVALLSNSTQFENIFSLGFEDYSRIAIDLKKNDGIYDPKTYENIRGICMFRNTAFFLNSPISIRLSFFMNG